MKQLLYLLLFTSIMYGQYKDVVIYGKVSSIYKDVKIDGGDIFLEYNTPDTQYQTFESVESNGFYSRKFKNTNKVQIETYYDDYYAERVIIEVSNRDSIRVDLKLIPKPYIYTREQALNDTRNGKIQLIIFDTLEYKWTRKINLKKDFGFEYLLFAEPEDGNFEEKMEDYNAIVKGYLGLKNSYWEEQLKVVKDSVVNFDADDYGRKNQIDVQKLKFPEKSQLPKMMQERLNTFQKNYESWYKDELKDYTFSYAIQVITTHKDYEDFRLLPERISVEYEKMLPELISLLINDTEIGLDGYDGIMWCRNLAPKQVQMCIAIPYSEDDLFTVAGRANHLLKLLTYEDFGDVLPNPDKMWLKKLQNRWAYWLLQLQEK